MGASTIPGDPVGDGEHRAAGAAGGDPPSLPRARRGAGVRRRAKDGVDAGELCGEGPTGVVATTDRDAVLKLGADCCVYMPRATGRGQTRAGLTEDELVDDVVALLESGTNVVTTCSDLFAEGYG